VRAVSAMFWQRIQNQVSCDCCAVGCRQNLVPEDGSHEQVSIIATDPMQGILFARAGLNISGSSEKRLNLVVPFCAYF